MGEGFQSDKITLSTNIWLYMYSHPLGYNWGGLEASKILHLPHKKNVGPRKNPRRRRKYCTCHTKRKYRVTGNFSEASKILHLAHKKELRSQATFRSVTGTSRRHQKDCTCHAKRRWSHKRPLGPGHEGTSRRHRKYCTCHTKRT